MSGINIQEAFENFSAPVMSEEEIAARRGGSTHEETEFRLPMIDGARGKATALLAGLTILASGGLLIKAASGESEHEQATEACVSALVGRDVDLVPGTSGLQRPASVFNEQVACERNSNDPVVARQHIRNIPLDISK